MNSNLFQYSEKQGGWVLCGFAEFEGCKSPRRNTTNHSFEEMVDPPATVISSTNWDSPEGDDVVRATDTEHYEYHMLKYTSSFIRRDGVITTDHVFMVEHRIK
jgi:hypothetical protein